MFGVHVSEMGFTFRFFVEDFFSETVKIFVFRRSEKCLH